MKWISNDYIKKLTQKYQYLLPTDFEPETYMLLHPDLIESGIDSAEKAIQHYLLYGIKEHRIYKKIIINENEISSIQKPEHWNNSKNILYFAPSTPDFDQSSGGNRLFQILKILVDLKYNVYFMCNICTNEKYTKALNNIGIKVFKPRLSGNSIQYLNQDLQDFLSNNIDFGYTIFSWYDMARQYFDIVKQYYPNTKIIIDTVDVHWVRHERGKLQSDSSLNLTDLQIEQEKIQEKQIYAKCDVIMAVTEADKIFIENEIGYNHNIKILSNIHDQRNPKLGKHIFFIGNYAHAPNISATKDAIKIFNKFTKTKIYQNILDKPKLYIVGANLPTEIQKTIKNIDHIDYLGKVEDLQELYSRCILLLCPLSWGAGIKGKICDASMSGIPVMTSDIGNEGISFTNKKNAILCNDEKTFVKGLEYFFSLPRSEQIKIGKSGQKHINKIVSREAAKKVLNHTLQDQHIVISIVTYNQSEQLDRCLDTLLNNTAYQNYLVHISDNSDNNYTRDLINKKYTDNNKIVYVKNNSNDYFIKPNNKVFTNKKYLNSDFVLLNDDIIITDKYWLNYLYSSAYAADHIAAVGGKTVFPNGYLAEAGAELYNNAEGRNIGRYENPNLPKYNRSRYVGYCSGCLLYMRHDAIKKIGIFDTDLQKLYYEDSEWQYRAHIKGLKTRYEHRCQAIHNEGMTSGTGIGSGAKKYQKINRSIFLDIMKHKYNTIDIEQYNEQY